MAIKQIAVVIIQFLRWDQEERQLLGIASPTSEYWLAYWMRCRKPNAGDTFQPSYIDRYITVFHCIIIII